MSLQQAAERVVVEIGSGAAARLKARATTSVAATCLQHSERP